MHGAAATRPRIADHSGRRHATSDPNRIRSGILQVAANASVLPSACPMTPMIAKLNWGNKMTNGPPSSSLRHVQKRRRLVGTATI